MSGYFKGLSLISIAIALIAYLYSSKYGNLLDIRLGDVLDGLVKAEKKVPTSSSPKTKVAIGFGGCVDYFGNGLHILKLMNAKPPVQPEHFDRISSLEELEKSFAYFFQHGAAAE